MISMEAAVPAPFPVTSCLYERLMGVAARERAAGLPELPPDRVGKVEFVEVWGTPFPQDARELRLYDFGGRVLAVARSR